MRTCSAVLLLPLLFLLPPAFAETGFRLPRRPPTRFPLTTISTIQVERAGKQKRSSRRWDAYLTRIYRQADLNRDGRISFDECYARVLLFYVKLNRQAPIPPPSRATMRRFYAEADLDHSSTLCEDEFKNLAATLASREAPRLLAHKLLTLLVAPWLATTSVHCLSTTETLASVRRSLQNVVERNFPDRLARLSQSTSFWKTIFLIVTMPRLGNFVLESVNWYMDRNLTSS